MVQGSGDMYLRLRITTDFVDDETADLWGLHADTPIIVEFKLLAPHFLQTSRV